MKKRFKIVLTAVLAVIVVTMVLNIVFPGLFYYSVEKFKGQSRHYTVESYSFYDLKADDGFKKIKQYGVAFLIPEVFESYDNPEKKGVVSFRNGADIMEISVPCKTDEFDFKFFITYDRNISDKKYESLKEKFIELYGSDTLSGYDYQKVLYEDGTKSGYHLRDKYQSYINYALNAERYIENPYGAVYSPIKNSNVKGYLLRIGYGSVKKEYTMLKFTFYNTADESKQYCVTYYCLGSTAIENACKSINSITFE